MRLSCEISITVSGSKPSDLGPAFMVVISMLQCVFSPTVSGKRLML